MIMIVSHMLLKWTILSLYSLSILGNMANLISPQVDIGGLTLRGLSAFTPLLASLSTDNIVPTAMLQMENLGGYFLISGEYTAKVPDYLQRCSSLRLERLAFNVGWHNGDATSLMASSAGGQAVALLSLCLLALYNSADAGIIFLILSQKLLPSTVAISNMAQLVTVGLRLVPVRVAIEHINNVHKICRSGD